MITQNKLKEILNYDPATGLFTWLVNSRNNQVKSGDIAGQVWTGVHNKSYILIGIEYRLYRAHRLAWLYMTGYFPAKHIDHINGDGCDNRFENLRSVSIKENSLNKRKYSTNKSGLTGVFWINKSSRYCAYIFKDKKKFHLGNFENIFDAACARKSAERAYGFHFNHGSSRPL